MKKFSAAVSLIAWLIAMPFIAGSCVAIVDKLAELCEDTREWFTHQLCYDSMLCLIVGISSIVLFLFVIAPTILIGARAVNTLLEDAK